MGGGLRGEGGGVSEMWLGGVGLRGKGVCLLGLKVVLGWLSCYFGESGGYKASEWDIADIDFK